MTPRVSASRSPVSQYRSYSKATLLTRTRCSRKECVMQQEHWIADRATLQRLLRLHPEWTQQELANWIGRSKGWVKKWKKRLREAPPGDARVLFGKPLGRKTPMRSRSCGGRTNCSRRRSNGSRRRSNCSRRGPRPNRMEPVVPRPGPRSSNYCKEPGTSTRWNGTGRACPRN